MWRKGSCLRKQHNDRDSNHRPSDPKFNALTTTPCAPPPGWGDEIPWEQDCIVLCNYTNCTGIF